MKITPVHMLVFLILVAPIELRAQNIPPHLVSMAAQLYKGVENDLKSKKLSPERQIILQETLKTLRNLGVHRWISEPARISETLPEVAEILKLDLAKKRDQNMFKEFMSLRANTGTKEVLLEFGKKANRHISLVERKNKAEEIDKAISNAQGKLGKTYETVPENGRSVHLEWKPDTDRFFMRIFDDGSGSSEEFTAIIAGDVTEKTSENGKDLVLNVEPSGRALRAITKADFEIMRRGNILGEWKDEKTGEVYQFSASDQKIGKVLPPPAFFNDQIDQVKDNIKSIKKAKIFKWRHPDTGKIVRQEKYRRLKEPFEFIGQQYALKNAEESIAKLETRISSLQKERDGGNLVPKNRYDPAGFGAISNTEKASAIIVRVTRLDGYSYQYDEAVFDGRRITAKRTYTDIRDIENPDMPERIRNQLINNGWKPPGWLKLEASLEVETGNMVLKGTKWALKVTYSGVYGSPPNVDRIHSPNSLSRVLGKEGTIFETAEGAARNFVP